MDKQIISASLVLLETQKPLTLAGSNSDDGRMVQRLRLGESKACADSHAQDEETRHHLQLAHAGRDRRAICRVIGTFMHMGAEKIGTCLT